MRFAILSELTKQRIPGATFDEVTYADDTICISTCTKAMNKFLKAIEEEGLKYGMKLNKGKCELITTHSTADVHFPSGQQVSKVKKATYLGCEVGIKVHNGHELNKRFANTMITMRKLDLFWRHSDCPTATKIHVAEAVLRAKLLYGLESAQLNPAVVRRLESFQLKVLRKILKMNTTYIDRANSNQQVFTRANEQLKAEQGDKAKKVASFIEAYKSQKRKRTARIIRKEAIAIHKISFNGPKLKEMDPPQQESRETKTKLD